MQVCRPEEPAKKKCRALKSPWLMDAWGSDAWNAVKRGYQHTSWRDAKRLPTGVQSTECALHGHGEAASAKLRGAAKCLAEACPAEGCVHAAQGVPAHEVGSAMDGTKCCIASCHRQAAAWLDCQRGQQWRAACLIAGCTRARMLPQAAGRTP